MIHSDFPINSKRILLNWEWIPKWTPLFTKDTTSQRQLQLANLEVVYEVVDKQLFQRNLSLYLTIQDSMVRSYPLSFMDTLNLSQLKTVRRASPGGLKGDMPTTGARIIKPLVAVLASFAGVISLFYLRSR